MRVITGTARGRKLQTLEGDDVRPTTDRVKEAMFSIIQFEIEGRRVLDLFAGSGQLGIEALSRGAAAAVFVDSSKKSIAVVRENLENTGFTKKSSVVNADSIGFLSSRAEKYDIAILDPPYNTGLVQKALEKISLVMNKSGVVICEAAEKDPMPQRAGEFVLTKSYRYGKVWLYTYRAEEFEHESE